MNALAIYTPTLYIPHLEIVPKVSETPPILHFTPEKVCYAPEPINFGLSPMWNPDRCVIPIADDFNVVDMPIVEPEPDIEIEPDTKINEVPAREKSAFVGKYINVLGFAQNCLISNIFTKWGDEYARLVSPYGVLYRLTKELVVGDIVS